MAVGAPAGALLDVTWRALVSVIAAPWLLALRWLSWAASLQLSFLASLGVVPTGFVPAAKVRELDGIISHMHLREDQYRQAIAELQDAVEAKEGDKKKALRSLKKTRLEMEALGEQLAQLRDLQGGGTQGEADNGAAAVPSLHGLHASMALLACAAFWFYQQDQPALQRKLVFTILSPLAWTYLTAVISRKAQRNGQGGLMLLHCAVWALLGFVAGCALATSC